MRDMDRDENHRRFCKKQQVGAASMLVETVKSRKIKENAHECI